MCYFSEWSCRNATSSNSGRWRIVKNIIWYLGLGPLCADNPWNGLGSLIVMRGKIKGGGFPSENNQCGLWIKEEPHPVGLMICLWGMRKCKEQQETFQSAAPIFQTCWKQDLMKVFPASLRASCILLWYTPYKVSHKQPESPLQGCWIYKNFSEISVLQRHSWLEVEFKVGPVLSSSRISLSMKIISENHPFISWSFHIQIFGS